MAKRQKLAIIMRGLPGSGKSTIAEHLAQSSKSSALHSTDSYFYKKNKYCFDYSKLGENHVKNLKAFETSCKRGKALVICDNTNILHKYYQPYFKIAKKYHYNCSIIVVDEFRPMVCYKRQNHGVPYSTIKRMKELFQK